MSAKILAVVNQKGGSGKTTVSMQVAGTLARRGYRVLVIDADPQRTAWHWAQAAPADAPFPTRVVALADGQGRLSDVAAEAMAAHDVIVIDGPPSHESPYTRAAMAIANLVLIPMKSSPADLWSTRSTLETLDEVRGLSDDNGPPAYLLPNEARVSNIGDAVKESASALGLPLMHASLTAREAYKESMALGSTVHATGNRTATQEVDMLALEVAVLLNLPRKKKP